MTPLVPCLRPIAHVRDERNGMSELSICPNGVQLFPNVLSTNEQIELAARLGTTNTRIANDPLIAALASPEGKLGQIAVSLLGPNTRPVKAIFFNKSPEQNWRVGWHQDRTIAVKEQIETQGFQHWTTKSGITHVEPPFHFIQNMISLRLHLDNCDKGNGPIQVVQGSHKLGKVSKPEIPDIVKKGELATCLALAGDAWAYASGIVHSSQRSQSPEHRRLLQIDYSAQDLPGEMEWLGLTNTPQNGRTVMS